MLLCNNNFHPCTLINIQLCINLALLYQSLYMTLRLMLTFRSTEKETVLLKF